MIQLHIVGTHHKHQFGPCSAFDPGEQVCDAFASFLRQQCQALGIQTLAEEMCSDSRCKWSIQRTVPELVAHELNISHADCGLNEDERNSLGILNEGDVRMSGWMQDRSADSIEQGIRVEYDKREREWICRLPASPGSQLLFVCGYAHSVSFADKAQKAGWDASVIVEEWTPNTNPNILNSTDSV